MAKTGVACTKSLGPSVILSGNNDHSLPRVPHRFVKLRGLTASFRCVNASPLVGVAEPRSVTLELRNGSMPATNSSTDVATGYGTRARPTGTDLGGATIIRGATLAVTTDPVLTTAPSPIRNVLPLWQTIIKPGPTKAFRSIITLATPRVCACAMIIALMLKTEPSCNSTHSGHSFSI